MSTPQNLSYEPYGLTPQQLVSMAKQLLPTQKSNTLRVSRHLNKFRLFYENVKQYGKPIRAYIRVYETMDWFELRAYITISDRLGYEREYSETIAKLSVKKITELINEQFEELGLDDYIALQGIYADLYFSTTIQAIKQLILKLNLAFSR